MVHVGRHASDWRAYIAVGIIAFCALQALAEVPKAGNQQRAQNGDVAKHNQANAATNETAPPANVIILNADQIEAKAAKDARDIRDHGPPDWWARILAVAAVVIAAVQTGVFTYQAVKLRQTVREGREAIDAASRAANASTRQADIAEDTAERQLRAYLSARPNFIHSFNEENYAASRTLIRNHGVTPAYRIQHRNGIAMIREPLTSATVLPPLRGEFTSPLILNPGDEFNATYTAAELFTVEEIADFKEGRSVICVFGEIIYRDSFRKKRRTRFCSFVGGAAELREQLAALYDKDDLKVVFGIAPMGNAAN